MSAIFALMNGSRVHAFRRIRVTWHQRTISLDSNSTERQKVEKIIGTFSKSFANEAELYAIMNASIKVGDMLKAEKIFQQLKNKPSDQKVLIYNSIIEGFGKTLHHDKSFKAFLEMKENGVKPNKITFMFVMRAILGGPRVYDNAKVILKELKEQDIPVSFLLKHPELTPKEKLKMTMVINKCLQSENENPEILLPIETEQATIIPSNQVDSTGFQLNKINQSSYSKITRSVNTTGLQDVKATLELLETPDFDLMAKQEQLELSVGIVAKKRYQTQIEEGKAPQRLKSSQLSQLVEKWREDLTKRVKALVSTPVRHLKDVSTSDCIPFLKLLDPEEIAHLSIMELINNYNSQYSEGAIWGGVKLAKLSVAIGQVIENAVDAREIKRRRSYLNLAPNRYVHQGGKLYSSELRRLASIAETNAEKEFGVWTPGWPAVVKAKIGSIILEFIIQDAKLNNNGKMVDAFYHTYSQIGVKKTGVIKFHPVLIEKISEASIFDSIQGKLLPMLVSPRPWLTHKSGGYLTVEKTCLRMKQDVKESYDTLREASENNNIEEVLTGLDVLGMTPWKINNKVLDVLIKIWESGGGKGEIPPLEDLAVKERPENFDQLKSSEKRAYYYERDRVLKLNRENHSQRCNVNYKLEIACAFRDRPIYFPHNLDFRGRAYPMPPHLNHVGSDLCRGLLVFHESKPLGERGLFWLKVHMANILGADKLSLEERVKYVEGKIDQIHSVAEDPLKNDWWLKEEDCWQCLATCFELSEALKSSNPELYESCLPVHQDGSCNGLQHYAALGGDVEGAKSVNLIDSEIPQDVYSKVSEKVVKMIEEESKDVDSENYELANRLLPLIDRKLVKQTVMTSVYGVTFIGAKQQIHSKLKDKMPSEENLYKSTIYITKKVFLALEQMFEGAREIQRWLTATAKEIASSIPRGKLKGISKKNKRKNQEEMETEMEMEMETGNGYNKYEKDDEVQDINENRNDDDDNNSNNSNDNDYDEFETKEIPIKGVTNVRWTTPLGLPIVQPYRKISDRILQTSLQNIVLKRHSDEVYSDVSRQKSAFPPNFIHSLDSTHMIMTALACHESLITFASVHDSFWTHANTVDQMNYKIREQFYRLHTQPILENLKKEFEERYGDNVVYDKINKRYRPVSIPPLPKKGSLDLSLVKQSKFFFD